jgi:hypothetical protein
VADPKSNELAVSKKPPMTPEERRRRYREMRERLGRSKIEVKAPEGITPIWAHKDNEYEKARMDWMGFKVVTEDMKPGAKKRFDAAGLRADGTYVLGDVILMEIDTETYLLQKEIEIDDFEAMRNNIPEEFKSEAKKNEVPVFEVTDKGEKVFANK